MPQPASPSRLRRGVPVSLLLSAAVLAGCGTETVNTGEMEDTITEQFKAQGIALTDVTCEDDVKAEVGESIACQGKNPAGTVLNIEGSVKSRDGDRVRFEAKAVSGVAPGTAIASEAKARLEQQVGRKAQALTCPDRVTLPTTPSVRCKLQADERTAYGVTITVDGQGKLNAAVDRKPLAQGQEP
ncbi:DUF4333 domain-containing protein [Patulibacter brassicae]|uniref:DUF4333 domain-containing protein n=1 Tax=Patulibacter brassicae TaxID=1705717 RepID=A0ABU4VGG6_9ACTN|nr:DUF4333 domain-containing protein [Patulibacter brassicae]MDX8149973.1 DUF4333 domain-containing protein [Patulibacter brassicae]